MSISNAAHSKSALFFYKISKFLVIGDLPGYIQWQESNYTRPIYKYIQNVLSVCIFIFVPLELASLFTQKNLSEKQATDMFILGFSHVILSSYHYVIEYRKKEIKKNIYKLCIELKNVYNDPKIERQMIKKSAIYSVVFLLNLTSALIFYGFDGVMQCLHGGTFVTVITAWPDVADESVAASIARVAAYFMWWVCMLRVSAVFLLVMTTTICLSYQFKNVQSYFYSLNEIFAGRGNSAQDYKDAEHEYEGCIKVGIQLHADTLWCTRLCQVVYGYVYSAQIITNVFVISLLMLQMMSSDRTPTTVLATISTSVTLLLSTGIFMWIAGDITFEAALVPNAMYNSGWQNCRGRSSQRVRKLLVIAINQAQRPVVLRSFGCMEISYQMYVTIVKASYSAFSILY